MRRTRVLPVSDRTRGSTLLVSQFLLGGLFVMLLTFLQLPLFAGSETPVSSEGKPAQIKFVKAWGQQGDQPGEFHFPIGITVNARDELFVTDNLNHRVQKFDTTGNLTGHFPVLGNPGAIDIDKDGNLYLTHLHASGNSDSDTGDIVTVYNADGKLLRQWGSTGSGEGEFDCPGGIRVAKGGKVYIADQTNHRVQVFDKTGKFLFKWGEYGNAPGQFGGKGSIKSRTGGPQFIDFDSEGNVWTTEGANCRIQKFSADGKLVSHWGTSEDQPGGFGGYFKGFKDITPKSLVGPIALCFDRDGNLWVGAVSGRVQQFSQDGKYLNGLGHEQGTEPGQFYAPHGLVFDSKGNLYVVDSYNHRIQKFEIVR